MIVIMNIFAGPYISTSSSCFSIRLTSGLMQAICWVQDFQTIVKDRDLNVIFPNKQADLLDIKLLKL